MAKKQAARPAKRSAQKAPAAKKAAAAEAKPKSLKPIFAGPVKSAPAVPAPPTKKARKESAPASAKKAKKEPAASDPKKPKLVRDSFTIPKSEYAVLEQMKKRAHALGRQAKKSELLRAGLSAIAALGDAAFVAAIDVVPRIKTGRPKHAKDGSGA